MMNYEYVIMLYVTVTTELKIVSRKLYNIAMVIYISIRDSVKENINAFELIIFKKIFTSYDQKRILTDQNECTQMRIDFE